MPTSFKRAQIINKPDCFGKTNFTPPTFPNIYCNVPPSPKCVSLDAKLQNKVKCSLRRSTVAHKHAITSTFNVYYLEVEVHNKQLIGVYNINAIPYYRTVKQNSSYRFQREHT